MTSSTTSHRALADAARETMIPSGVEEIYLFGSARYTDPARSDIDLLVVYENGLEREASARIGAPIMASLGGRIDAPLHLLLLSDHEVDEVGFIESEDAVRIWPEPAPTS